MFKNYLEYIQGILLIHMNGMCSPEKVNSGDDTQKAYRDINNIDGILPYRQGNIIISQ